MADRVVHLHPEQPETEPQHGAFGLGWNPRYQPDTRRWATIGRDRTWVAAKLEVHSTPGRVAPQELATLVAFLLNDIGEDAGSLALADLMQQRTPDALPRADADTTLRLVLDAVNLHAALLRTITGWERVADGEVQAAVRAAGKDLADTITRLTTEEV